jgi:hypothetical protein
MQLSKDKMIDLRGIMPPVPTTFHADESFYPEKMKEISEKKKVEIKMLSGMNQQQRFQFLVNRYQKNLPPPE